MKRAVLSLGRARPDILHTLDASSVKAAVLAVSAPFLQPVP